MGDAYQVLMAHQLDIAHELAKAPARSRPRLERDLERLERALQNHRQADARPLSIEERLTSDELALILGSELADDEVSKALERVTTLRVLQPRAWLSLPAHLVAAEQELRKRCPQRSDRRQIGLFEKGARR